MNAKETVLQLSTNTTENPLACWWERPLVVGAYYA